jgi:hypothetical protein
MTPAKLAALVLPLVESAAVELLAVDGLAVR